MKLSARAPSLRSAALLVTLLSACLPPLQSSREPAEATAGSSAAGDPLLPPADVFDTRATPRPIRADYTAQRELERVASAVAGARSPALTGDGRLADMALALARRLAPDEQLEPTSLAPLAQERGLTNPMPQVLFASAGSLEELRSYLIEQGPSTAVQYQNTHFGLAAAKRGLRWFAVLVLDRRPLELAPIPRSLAAAGDVRIAARLLDGMREPALVVTFPDGASTTVARGKSPDELEHTLKLTPGAWGIEIMGTGEHGPAVVANFLVQVGQTSAPAAARVTAVSTQDPAPATVPAFVAQLEALIHAERERAGSARTTRSAALDAVALAHSTDMSEHKFFGHVSSTTGGQFERIVAAGVAVWGLRENVARGYSPRGVHESLMASPAHRAALLTKDVDLLGIGVTMEYEGTRPVFHVTELFARAPHAFDPGLTLDAGAKRLTELRAARGLPPVIPDARLSASARAAAERFFQQPTVAEEKILQSAFVNVRVPHGAKKLSAGLFLGLEPGELQATDEMFDPTLKWIGVGVAQGSHPRTGSAGLAVVLLMAR